MSTKKNTNVKLNLIMKKLILFLLFTVISVNAQTGKPYIITPQLQLKTIPEGTKEDSLLVADDVGRVRFVSQSYLLSKRLNLIDAKQFGAIADGITDDTVILQDYLDNGQGVYLFPKGVYSISGLDINPDSKLIFEKGSILALRDNSDRPVLQNKNFQGSTNTDKNIEIYGLEIEGNEANQISVGVSDPYTGEPTAGVRFFGVENLKIINAKINKAKKYGIWLSRITNGVFNDIEFNQSLLTISNQDGIHFNGLCYNLEISNIRGVTNDDMIALNADDVAQGANVSFGEIKNATIKDVIFDNNLNGIRLLSAGNLLDQIYINNLSGNVRDNVIAISSYALGTANFGSIYIDGVNVDTNTPYMVMGEYGGYILVNDKIEYLKISNVFRKTGADARPTVRIQSRADISKLVIDNVTNVINQSLTTYYPEISFESGSVVAQAFISNIRLMNGVFPNGYCVGATGATISKLHLNNIYAEQIGYGLYLNNTDISTLFVNNLQTNYIRYPFYLENDSDIAGLISNANGWYYSFGTPHVYNILDTSSIVYYNGGEVGKLVKWGSNSDQVDSLLYDDGISSVGLGTNNPKGAFNIFAGSDTVPVIAFGDYTGYGWGFLERTTDGNMRINGYNAGVPVTALELQRGTGNVLFGGTTSVKSYTVATLPTPTGTAYATVTDALAPTYLTVVVGGGSVTCPVFYNGTNWVCH